MIDPFILNMIGAVITLPGFFMVGNSLARKPALVSPIVDSICMIATTLIFLGCIGYTFFYIVGGYGV